MIFSPSLLLSTLLFSSLLHVQLGKITLKVNNQYNIMMKDISKSDKMFGVVMSDDKGQFCEVGTAVENYKQDYYGGNLISIYVLNFYFYFYFSTAVYYIINEVLLICIKNIISLFTFIFTFTITYTFLFTFIFIFTLYPYFHSLSLFSSPHFHLILFFHLLYI